MGRRYRKKKMSSEDRKDKKSCCDVKECDKKRPSGRTALGLIRKVPRSTRAIHPRPAEMGHGTEAN
jgi:hypothetical protein